MKTLRNNSKGFTLLELMIAIAILGVLASIAIPSYMEYVKKAKSAACLVNRHATEDIIMAYYIENPDAKLENLSQLVSKGCLDKEPQCPYGGEYILIPADKIDSKYPKVGCSLHYWPVPAAPAPKPKPVPKPKPKPKPKPVPKPPRPVTGHGKYPVNG